MKMDAFKWTTIFIIITMPGATNSKTVSDLCSGSWRYHKHTGTCITKSSTRNTFDGAKQYCESMRGGPNNDEPGWLVSIHDKETDDFVKNLLKWSEKAFIGLIKENNDYVWVAKNTVNRRYRGWDNNFPTGGFYTYKYVVTTKYGWQDEYYATTKYKFICQKYPAFSLPSFTCGSVEEGKPFPRLYCDYPMDETVTFFEKSTISRIGSSMFCDSNLMCHSSSYLSGNIYRTSGFLTTELIVNRQVSRTDDGQRWSCRYKFNSTPNNLLTTHCKTETFKMPKNVSCEHSFPSSGGILFACHANGGFPKFSSEWRSDNRRLGQRQGKHQEKLDSLTVYYNSKFQYLFNTILEGTHNIYISMYPPTTFPTNEAKLKATITKTIQVTISVPKSPPRFFVESDITIIQNILTVIEDQSVILICEINGGNPMVSRAFVQCDGKYVKDISGKTFWDTSGQTVRIEFLVKRAMDKKVCTCKGQHVSNQYKDAASVTLNVQYPAKLINFQLNGRSQSDISVYEKTRVNLACSAYGNPRPTLHIYKLDESGEILKTLKNTSGTSVSYTLYEASCNMSGKYVCTAVNSLNSEMSKREISLKIKCSPKPCSERYSDREVKILQDANATFRLCLYAYPIINPNIIVKPKDKPNLVKDSYSTRFVYANALETKGYVLVNLSQSVAKLGEYTMQVYQSNKWYNIDFSLVSYPKASCPRSLDFTLISSRFVVVSWQPAIGYGVPQTLTLTTTDSKGHVLGRHNVADDKQLKKSQNITGLVPGTYYKLGVEVKNAQGITICPHLMLNVTTNTSSVAASKASDTRTGALAGALVGVFIAVTIICLLIFIILRRRRHNERPKMPIWLRRGKKESKIFTEVTESKRASNRRSQHEPVEDIYSKVNKPKKKAVEQERSVYSNTAAIELHSKQQPVGSRGDPTIGYFTQPSYDDQRRASHDFDWSDDSMDDIARDIRTKSELCEMVDPEVSYRRQDTLRRVLAEYANSASISETEMNAAFSNDNFGTHLPLRPEIRLTSNSTVANGPIGNVKSPAEEYSNPMKKCKPGQSKDWGLKYIEVEVRPSENGVVRFHPANHLEEPVDYASLNYDADVSDSETLGDA